MSHQCPGSPSNLADIAATLREAAQALVNFSQSHPPGEATQDKAEDLAERDEYRSYRVPFYVLNAERELLAEYDTDRIAHVLRDIHTEFFLMVELMKGYAERNDDEDFTYFLIAQQLFKPLDRLSKACLILVDFELQQKETV